MYRITFMGLKAMDLVIGILIVDSLNTWGHPLLTLRSSMVAMRLFVILVLPILVVKVLYAFLATKLNEVLHVKRLKANLRSINKVCDSNFVVRFS